MMWAIRTISRNQKDRLYRAADNATHFRGDEDVNIMVESND
jgi:hypothetical protein